jgi:hypothetical protein
LPNKVSLFFINQLSTMSHTSVFVYPYDVFGTSISAIVARLSDVTSRRVVRIDYVSGEARYYFVHFDQEISAEFYNLLSAGQTSIFTTEGPIRVGLNRSNGLDPTTTDRIQTLLIWARRCSWRFAMRAVQAL